MWRDSTSGGPGRQGRVFPFFYTFGLALGHRRAVAAGRSGAAVSRAQRPRRHGVRSYMALGRPVRKGQRAGRARHRGGEDFSTSGGNSVTPPREAGVGRCASRSGGSRRSAACQNAGEAENPFAGEFITLGCTSQEIRSWVCLIWNVTSARLPAARNLTPTARLNPKRKVTV